MTGMNQFVALDEQCGGVQFKIKGAKNKINVVKIILTEDDLYNVNFIRYSPSKLSYTPVSSVKGVYNDMLQDIFTEHTGLYTSLF